VIIEIECMAHPPGTEDDRYKHIDAAIAVAQRSGLKYEVSALGTTVEGEPDEVWALARAMHEACLESGAGSLLTFVKFEQTRDVADQPTMASLTSKFR
jgi:uncharacterized protein YqgV (UPF0045/DUF77 family)